MLNISSINLTNPVHPTPKRNESELEVELNKYNPQIRIKSADITQSQILEIIKRLHENLLYISYDRFKNDLNVLTGRFFENLHQEKYAVGLAPRKSNTWVAAHAMQGMNQDQLPSTTFELELNESSETISSSLREAIQAGIKNFAIFDDVIYTGSQMKSHIFRFLGVLQETKDLHLYIIVPYVSDSFKTSFTKLDHRFHLISTETVIPTVDTVIADADISLLNNLYPQSALNSSHHLLYTDWKVADIKSVPQFLHCGLKLKEGVFRFLRSPEPLYPPYKNRELQQLIFDSYDDPFENKSSIEFLHI